jgi:hypothetical protein
LGKSAGVGQHQPDAKLAALCLCQFWQQQPSAGCADDCRTPGQDEAAGGAGEQPGAEPGRRARLPPGSRLPSPWRPRRSPPRWLRSPQRPLPSTMPRACWATLTRLVGGKRNPLVVLHVAALRPFIAFAHRLPGDVGGAMFSGVYQAQARLHSRNVGPGRAAERAGAGRGRQKFYQPGYSRHR